MDCSSVCDLWFPVRCRLNALVKYWNDEMWMRGKMELREESVTQGSTGGGGEIKEWKREERAHPLLKRVVRRALLEVPSRLNGATEGNMESITPVLLTLLLFPSSVLLTLRISHPFCLPPPSFLLLAPVSPSPSLTWEVITTQSANQINADLLGCGGPQNCDLLWWNVIDNGCKAPLLSTQRTSMTTFHTHTHPKERTDNAYTCLNTTRFRWHSAFTTHFCI